MQKHNFKFQNQGFSLIEVLVAAGIMAVVMVATGTMIVSQLGQTKHIEQKLEILDLKGLMQTFFTDANRCVCQFNPPTVNSFDSTDTSGAQSIALTKVLSDCAAQNLIQTAQKLPSGMTVQSISFSNLKPVTAPTWAGEWTVTFGNISGSAFRPLILKQLVTIDPTVPTAAKIIGCQSSGTTQFKNVNIVAIPAFPFNGLMNFDFTTLLPVADQGRAVALQIVIENLVDVIPTGVTGAEVNFAIDGSTAYNFYFDTATFNERFHVMIPYMVGPGVHAIQMNTQRCNPLAYQIRITGYLVAD